MPGCHVDARLQRIALPAPVCAQNGALPDRPAAPCGPHENSKERAMLDFRIFGTLLAFASGAALAAPPAYLTLDNSSAQLMDAATASALWKQNLPAKMFRLYPVKKWGFVSEVEGGFDDARVCVVTARAMMLPRNGKTLVFQPAKTATAFGTQANASADQCRAFAKAKLGEAVMAVSTSLVGR